MEVVNKKIDYYWKYGYVTSGDLAGDLTTSMDIYEIESNFANSVSAKIGLMYISDYGLSTSNWKISSATWLFSEYDEMLFSRWYNEQIWYINTEGALKSSWIGVSFYVRPVFYLENTAKISSGDGTLETPYI